MKAMILAAGFGKRLLPITKTTPKALVMVKGRPVLGWIIEQLDRNGFREIFINTHYLHDRIKAYVTDLNTPCKITLSHETEILGTGGGVLNAGKWWGDEACYVCNGDILCDLNIQDFIAYHQSGGCSVTLAVHNSQSSSMLLIDKSGMLCGRFVDGKQTLYADPCGALTAKGFAGIHLIESSFIMQADTTHHFSIIDQYTNLIQKGLKIFTYTIKNAYWIDIGTLDSLKQANREFKGFSSYSPS